MKGRIKKVLGLFALFIIASVSLFAAAPAINSKYGYFDIAWGSTLGQIKMKGYELSPMDEDIVASEQTLYKKPISIYTLSNKKDKFVVNTVLYFYDGKLFKVTEILNKSMASASKVAGRYGKFADAGIYQSKEDKNRYCDYTYTEDGYLSNASIWMQIAGDTVEVQFYDFSVLSKINRASQKLAGKATIADELYEIAGELLENTDKSKKISMAFVALTSDAQNKFVENYVTDALTQSVFETGNVRIIERANLEKILAEQKFQAGGLVDDNSAKAIGKIAGVDYVCYGDMKDIGDEITINARIVDVESGEVLAISRTTVEKDKYLRDYIVTQKKVEKERVQAEKKAVEEQLAKSKWEVTKNRNKSKGYTTYTFINRTDGNQFIFFGYDKYDDPRDSVVQVGFRWGSDDVAWKSTDWCKEIFVLTGDSGNVYKTIQTSGYAYWSFSTGWKANSYDSCDFMFAYHPKLNKKEVLNMFGSNNTLTVEIVYRDTLTKRFDTSMFWEVLAANGITKEEIFAAIDNEDL
ncbi:MAG: hypothetical protein J6J00_01335 [Treponema sp.]|nr:hypothetical protein [Treponema sp.]